MINSLNDLRKINSAPVLNSRQEKKLYDELLIHIDETDWFTVGIMAPSANLAISVLKEIESHFGWPPMKVASKPNGNGPVFLKANQHTGDIHVRIEYGLGEGVLIGCQFHSEEKSSATIGPLPLNFFKVKNHEEANPLMSNKPE